MSRIFDALKKAQSQAQTPTVLPSTSAPLPAAVPPPVQAVPPRYAVPREPAPLRPAEPIEPAWPREVTVVRPVIEAVRVLPLPDDVAREMTTLRIGIEAALEERGTRAILFLSPQGGEGTTSVAAEFAVLLAGDPRVRALLVDAHARRPAIGSRFRGAAPIESAAEDAGILAVAALPPELADRGLFPPSRLRETIAASAGTYDWVVVDGPPVLEAPDAIELACQADGVVLVLAAGSSKRQVVTRSVELLRKGGARVLGSVLNRRRHEIPEFIYRRL